MGKAKSGFTLIELLVVIAIIAILAAILFPVFMSAKRQAKAIACLSNEKQIGTAFLAYSTDWDGWLPMIYPPAGTQTTGDLWGFPWITWMTCCRRYVNNDAVLACPARPKDGAGKVVGTSWGSPVMTRPLGYAMNAVVQHYQFYPGIPVSSNGCKLSSVIDHPRKILVVENSKPYYFMAWMGMASSLIKAKMHGDKLSFLFFDGHAKAMRLRDTVANGNMWNLLNRYPMLCNGYSYAKSEKEFRDTVNTILDDPLVDPTGTER